LFVGAGDLGGVRFQERRHDHCIGVRLVACQEQGRYGTAFTDGQAVAQRHLLGRGFGIVTELPSAGEEKQCYAGRY
jgi:hypothetical protein